AGRWCIDIGHLRQEFNVVRAVPRLVQSELLVQLFLLNERKNRDSPTEQRSSIVAAHYGGRQMAMLVLVPVHGQCQLNETSGAAVEGITNLRGGERPEEPRGGQDGGDDAPDDNA